MTARVLGRQALNRKLARLPQAAKDEIRKALVASAREIADLAESLVPKDSGLLAGSIGWTWGDAPKGSISLGQVRGGDLTITVYAGDDQAFYSRFVEHGTVNRPATPFFFPAYRAVRKRARSRISRATTKAAKRVAAS